MPHVLYLIMAFCVLVAVAAILYFGARAQTPNGAARSGVDVLALTEEAINIGNKLHGCEALMAIARGTIHVALPDWPARHILFYPVARETDVAHAFTVLLAKRGPETPAQTAYAITRNEQYLGIEFQIDSGVALDEFLRKRQKCGNVDIDLHILTGELAAVYVHDFKEAAKHAAA